MNYKEYLIKALKKFAKDNIIIDEHAGLRARQRGVDIEEVYDNLLKPSKRLSFVNKLEEEEDKLEKYKCYFSYSKTQCQIYIIKVNDKLVVKTIIKLNKRWQKKAEKHGKI